MEAVFACESFIKDCDELYANYLMTSMIATEGAAMDNVKYAAHKAWEAIKALARKIADAIANAARSVGALFSKIKTIRNKVPDVIVLKKKDYKVYDTVVESISDMKQDIESEIDATDKLVEEAMRNAEQVRKYAEASAARNEAIDDKIDTFNNTIRDMINKIRSSMENGETIAFESLDPSTIAFEADNGNDTKQAKIGPIRDWLSKMSEKCSQKMARIENAIKDLKAKIDQSAGDESADGVKKQRMFAKLLKSLSALGGAIKSVAGRIGTFFSNIITMMRRGKSTVSSYDGPEPDLA